MVHPFTTNDPDLKKLLEISSELFDIRAAGEVLHWDQETYMPPKGILHRSRQLSTLSAVFHAKITDKNVGKLVNLLTIKLNTHPVKYTDTDRALVREMKRAFDKATKIPERLVRDMSQAASDGLEAWKVARQNKNYAIFEPPLANIVSLKKQEAELVGYKTSPYDALLDDYEEGLTAERVQEVFDPLKNTVKNLLNKIQKTNPKEPKSILRGQKYPKLEMLKITEKILEKMGFDFSAGRQDLSAHPFTINFGHQDVRVTNRYIENDLASSIFSAVHEGGHALYELGISDILANTILAGGVSLGIHESQSRLWENFIGRSIEFWKYWTPYLQAELPVQLGEVTPQLIFREINSVEPGFIRVDADEVTYNLHIIVRFEIEKDLLEGKIKIKDLPEIWNVKYHDLLGITPPDDSLGLLQDIHWSQGSIGYFPTYTLGNLYAAQFYNKMCQDAPDFKKHIESGNFEPLLHWLRQNIHQHGSIYTAGELVKSVTGQKLNSQFFVNYLEAKYNEIYNL